MMELRAEKISQDFLRDSAREGYIVAVAETDLCLSSGTVTAVMGRSGSGKSTLLHILGGLLPPVTGKVLIGETDLYALPEDARAELRSSTLGIVPQQLMSLRALTVRENVLLSALLYGREQDVSASAVSRTRLSTCRVFSASRSPVGSSRSRICGTPARARAIIMRRSSPPESSDGQTCASGAMPSRSIRASACADTSCSLP